MTLKTIAILFLAFLLSGCMGQVPEPPPDPDGSTAGPETEKEAPSESDGEHGELDEEFIVDNESLVVRFETLDPEGIVIPREKIISQEEEWTRGIFLQGGGHYLNTSFMEDAAVHLNDETITVVPDGENWSMTSKQWPGANRPGEHVIAFYAAGMTVSFRVTSSNATYEILENETISVRYLAPDHPDWEKETYVAFGPFGRLEGMIEVTPELESMKVNAVNWGDGSMNVEISYGNGFRRCPEKGSGYSNVVFTDQSVRVTVKSTSYVTSHVVSLIVVDWSLEVQKNKCWADP